MEKIKRFLDCYIPTETCNLRCHYCYITQRKKFNNRLAHFKYPAPVMRKALSRERLRGTCLLNLCAGGETLLSQEVLDITKALLEEGHFVMIVTNGTLKKRFEEIAKWPDELFGRLFFKFSFHYLELKRLDILDQYFDNIALMNKRGASFTVEITPSDELIPYIPVVKNICMEKLGALCHVTIARDDRTEGIEVLSEHNFEEYKKIWGEFASTLFSFKSEIFYKKRTEFCYAGEWSAYLNLNSGDLRQCYCGKWLDNIYQDVEKPINFEPIGHKCTQPHCYNGHAFLTLGDIPELKTPTYAEVRNRICVDGSEWLSPTMKAFMSTKLVESNKEYNTMEKVLLSLKETKDSVKQELHIIKNKILKK